MAGTKVSQLADAADIGLSDLLYLVNSSSPRKLTLQSLINFLTSQHFITSINGLQVSDGSLEMTKSDIGLANVPNVNPVTTLNTLSGLVNIVGDSDISVDVVGSNINLSFANTLSIPFSKLTGDISDNPALAAALATVGIQQPSREINPSTSTALEALDASRLWVNVVYGTPVTLTLSALNLPEGAIIEIRQGGSGAVSVTEGDGATTIQRPDSIMDVTAGIGSRIQLISLGGNAWEFR